MYIMKLAAALPKLTELPPPNTAALQLAQLVFPPQL